MLASLLDISFRMIGSVGAFFVGGFNRFRPRVRIPKAGKHLKMRSLFSVPLIAEVANPHSLVIILSCNTFHLREDRISLRQWLDRLALIVVDYLV